MINEIEYFLHIKKRTVNEFRLQIFQKHFILKMSLENLSNQHPSFLLEKLIKN